MENKLPKEFIVKVTSESEFHIVQDYCTKYGKINCTWNGELHRSSFKTYNKNNIYHVLFSTKKDCSYNDIIMSNWWGLPVIPFSTFTTLKENKEEFILPNRWYVKSCANTYNTIATYFSNLYGRRVGGGFDNYYHYPEIVKGICGSSKTTPGYKEITIEQFYKYVLQQNKSMNTFEVTREELKQIYDIACSEWKDKIVEITESVFGPFTTKAWLKYNQVEEMFNASNANQLVVLKRIFPTYGSKFYITDLKTGEAMIIEGNDDNYNSCNGNTIVSLGDKIWNINTSEIWRSYNKKYYGKRLDSGTKIEITVK